MSVTPHITFLVHTVVIQLLVLGIERHNRLSWAAFVGFVSLAVQRLPKFFIPTFPVPRFLLPRYSLRLWNCAQHAYSQLTFRRQRPAEITGEVADPCKTRKKRLSSECAVLVLSYPVWRHRRRRRRCRPLSHAAAAEEKCAALRRRL